MGKEIWKDIPDYDGIYKCSNLGRVKSIGNNCLKKTKILKQAINKTTKYHSVGLNKNNKKIMFTVHTLLAFSFLNYKKIDRKTCINHIDGNRENNNISNLEIVSMSYNVKDGFNRGRIIHNKGKYGKDNHSSKIIYRYDLDMNYIDFFYGAGDAEKKTGIKAVNIKQNTYGSSKTCSGYIFSRKAPISCS